MTAEWIFVCDEAGRWEWVCRDSDGRLRKGTRSFDTREACGTDATRHGWNGVDEELIYPRERGGGRK